MRYLIWKDNLISESFVSVSANTANLAFEADNVRKLPVAEPWRSAEGITENADLYFDWLNPAPTVRNVFIIGHNFTEDATVTLYGHSTTHGLKDQFSQAFTYRDRIMWAEIDPAETTRRFWTIEIDDAGNTDGFLRIGAIIFGDITTLGIGIDQDWTLQPVYVNRSVRNPLGTSISSDLLSFFNRISFQFRGLQGAQLQTILDLVDEFEGSKQPILILPLDEDDAFMYFGRFKEQISTVKSVGHDSVSNLVFEEDTFPKDFLETIFDYQS